MSGLFENCLLLKDIRESWMYVSWYINYSLTISEVLGGVSFIFQVGPILCLISRDFNKEQTSILILLFTLHVFLVPPKYKVLVFSVSLE